MAANFLHGVETVEVQKGARPVRVVRSAVIGLVGIAPAGPENELTLVQSDTDAAVFGAAVPGFTIPQAIDAIFAQGNAGTILVVNAYDPGKHNTSETDEAVTVEGGAFKTAYAPLANITITDETGDTTYVDGTDYTHDAFGNFTVLPGGDITEGEALLASYDRLDPAAVEAGDIIGAVDSATDARTGLQVFDLAFSRFGFNPRLLIAPGYSSTAAVTDELITKAGAYRGHAIVDAPKGTAYQDVIEGRGPAGSINFNTSSKRAILCYPHLKAYDAATDSNVDAPYSQYLAGVIAATDLQDGFWFSPSNREISGIVGLEREITASLTDPATQANTLNENGITTVFNSFGSGLRTWGNRSAAFPSSTHVTNFIPVQRTADIIHDSIEQSMLQFVDLPINDALIDAVRGSVNAFLRTLVQRGAIIDGECVYDPAKNPPEEIAAGHITFDISFMPPTPAERITFDSFIDINLLSQLGGIE